MATQHYHRHQTAARPHDNALPRCEEQAIRQARRDATALGLPAAVVVQYLSDRRRTLAEWRAWNTTLAEWQGRRG